MTPYEISQYYGSSRNPVYDTVPGIPPGLAAIPYAINDFIAPMVGGVASPYVAENMSTYSAQIAKSLNRPRSVAMASRAYAQFGEQLANTVGALPIVDTIGEVTGYGAENIRKDLSSGGRSFMGGTIGQFITPMADSMLSQAGISGGSFIKSMEAISSGAHNLMGAGMYFNPLDPGQASKSMAAASAMMTLTNGLISQRDENGRLSLLTNMSVTQGFERERISSLAVKAAGMGLFTSRVNGGFGDRDKLSAGGFEGQLKAIAGDYDLSEFSFEDLANGKANKVVDKKTAERLKAFTRDYADKLKGLTEAMGAMRDLTGSVDNLEEKLTDLTNGNWMKSRAGLYRARDTADKLNAISQVYNIDPNDAIKMIKMNRATMQEAAGITPHMKALGFDGGGMFGFAAQTAVLQNTEDKITASGARGDPVAEARIRYQSANALARSVNTSAGRASQLLAYARQTGTVDENQASAIRARLTSGERGLMEEGLNRLLVTMFGSAETGRKMMNDTHFMQSVRQSMDDRAGTYANMMMTGGASAEMREQEKSSMVKQRLDYTNTAMRKIGRTTGQTEAGVNKIVDAVVSDFASVKDDKGEAYLAKYGNLFKEQFNSFREKGMSHEAALRATENAFKKDPETAKFASRVSLAITRQAAENNEEAVLGKGGEAGFKANALLESLSRFKDISGDQRTSIRKSIKEGRSDEALAELNGIVGSLSKNKQDLYKGVLDRAGKDYGHMKSTLSENRTAEIMLDAASSGNHGGEEISKAIEVANEAVLTYVREKNDPKKAAGAYERFKDAFSKTRIGEIYGDDKVQEYMSAAEKGDTEYVKRMGRIGLRLKQMATQNMDKNGWDSTYDGFFSSGIYSGNAELAKKDRDSLINKIASVVSDDRTMSAEDRSGMARDVVGFLTGQKDLKGVLKIHDRGGNLTSKLGKYLEKNEEFEMAQKESESARVDYASAMNSLRDSGKFNVKRRVEEMIKNNPEISDRNIEDISKELSDVDDKTKSAIVGYMRSRQKMQKAQTDMRKEIEVVAADKEVPEEIKRIKYKQSMESARKEKVMAKNEQTFAYMDSLDTDEASLDSARGKLKEAQDAMFKLVSEKDVAKKAKSDTSRHLSKQEYAETALAITKERAAKGDKDALDVVKKFSVAQREQASRLTGDITLKHGNEQYPASLELSVGGSLS